MRRILSLLILALSSLSTLYAQYINIGSTKSEVKKIQGEPNSIQVYDNTGEEIWGYGENGLATITFKNSRIKSFNNYQKILKVGENSSSTKTKEESISKENLWRDLREKAKNTKGIDKEEISRSTTGLHGSGGQSVQVFPKEYEEMAEANGLNPYAMPDETTLQQMQKEYEAKKAIKWGLISLGTIGFLFLIFKIKNKKK